MAQGFESWAYIDLFQIILKFYKGSSSALSSKLIMKCTKVTNMYFITKRNIHLFNITDFQIIHFLINGFIENVIFVLKDI